MNLAVDGLCAGYGRAGVLADVSLSVAPGEVLLLLGRNGAGKSTTLKAIMGVLRPTAGSVRLGGEELAGHEPWRVARAGIGWVPEDRRVFADLTTEENLETGRGAARAGLAPWTPERLFRLFPNLAPLRRRPGGQMSGGEQQMLAIARTLMGNPRVLLLDEPAEGLAPLVVAQVAEAVLACKREGLAVVLAEQNPRFADAIADRATMLRTGQVVWSGTMAEMTADRTLRDRMLAV